MLAIKTTVFLLLAAASSLALLAGEVPYRAVRITATVQPSPRAAVRLLWNADSTATGYVVSRKLPGAGGWSRIAETGADTVFTDTTIEFSKEYEYQVVKAGVRDGLEYTAAGYISAGAEIPFDDARGTIALVIDSSMAAAISEELSTLESDLEGDGWRVRRVVVGRGEAFDGKKVRAVKREIQRLYDAGDGLRAVLLLGRIPVPYSGRFVADDHDEHLGAWPADCYYADVSPAPIDERWSDLFVLQTTAAREENRNRRIDGKFDQSELPSAAELAVGRVDFWDLPAAGADEAALLRRYLRRNHDYRHAATPVRDAACFWDNFDVLGEEMFAQSARSNAASLFGNAAVFEENWIGAAADSAFQFGFAAGPGSYTSCGGVGDAAAAQRTNAVFGSLIGSYFGDWDNRDNLLRSALAGSRTLAVWWSGRPQWHLHRCAAGQPLGTAALATLNNDGTLYEAGRYTRGIHIALLGDPTLRFFPVPPVRNLTATATPDSVYLRWDSPAENIVGYAIYRDVGTGFLRLNSALTAGGRYAEPKPAGYSAATRYMVRAVRLQVTASGSFFNPAQGIIARALPQSAAENTPETEGIAAAPQPAGEFCDITVAGAAGVEFSVEICDALGRIIALPESSGGGWWRWNAGGAAPGIYCVRATSRSSSPAGRRIIVGRLVKM